MKFPFKYYLHDDSDSWAEAISDALPTGTSVEDVEQILERAQRPFYEVTLECELDTDTGEVKILKSDL